MWHARQRERSLSCVPRSILAVLLAGLVCQAGWHHFAEKPQAKAESLTGPPAQPVLQLIALGEPAALSRLLMLHLQAFDNQPGISIPFVNLDYDKLRDWLEAIALLDLESRYPYQAAARVYAEVQDDDKKRLMLDFIHRGFLRRPNQQWPAMAHAVFIARHRLQDLELALVLARDLRQHLTDPTVPSWARQMELFVLEELGDTESAKILLGAFLESGIIRDEKEFAFLKERLGLTEPGP